MAGKPKQITNMTIQEAAIKYAKTRNKKKMLKLLDWIEKQSFGDPMEIPLACPVNFVGEENHHWVWDVCEEWKNN